MSGPPLTPLDRALLAAFGRHTGSARLAKMRQHYRATPDARRFSVFVARVFGLSWVAFLLGAGLGYHVGTVLPRSIVQAIGMGMTAVPLVSPAVVERALVPAIALTAGGVAKRATIRAAGAALARRARRRRERIERTLPRTVRYMYVLASGTTDLRTLLSRVAERERAFGETARTVRRVLRTASVTGTVDGALRVVARDTPSRRTLAPFLLTLRSRARDEPAALAEFLHQESRFLARRDAQRTDTAKRYLGSVVRLFVGLLVVPAMAIVALGVATGLGERTPIPAMELARWIRGHVLLSPASAVVVLGLGTVASGLVYLLRPPGYRWSRYRTSNSLRRLLATVHRNPANALVVFAPLGSLFVVAFWHHGAPLIAAGPLGYALAAIPVGLVDRHRASIDAAKDRYLPEFLHEVAHQVHLGRSFTEAVGHVAANGGLGPLDPDVADLAFDLRVATNDRPVRAAALDRFVDRVGTPLARRTVGMIAGALDAGSQSAAAFEALQGEAGRLYHEEQAVRDEVPIFLAVGWAASLLVVGIVVAVNVAALGTTVPGGRETVAIAGVARSTSGTPTFYFLTQATVLSSGLFAGVAGRGVYEGFLHSGGLVLITFLAFAGTGLL
ncbi:type II secretion system F family protein [Halanaeroarchaeum sulfurireducens]|uniref:Flagella assembly protein J n=1 Tax=Halanaeroarchaeum sulfurireducens TaxID=1604004 RepID=A0A0F7P8H7_9EURY|nr:type II secretion system F family protein [Halanaeroarchaeum sulfurireducens]AKH97052.1 flagella assembly protein J [Halanaeroarchaeum sulfurireducens]ALG81453.1 flagella assembly protein J [Halanaeroarchaeum sulfurireducens]